MSIASHPSASDRLSDRAYAVLRQMIVECQLAPGSAVSEPDLSTKLGQSRAGMRAALVRLAQDGLVRAVPRRGYVVSPLTLRDAGDLFGLRLLIEPPAAAMAAGKLPPEAFGDIERIFSSGYRRSDPGSMTRFLAANRAFRVLVAGASGNRRLADQVAQLVDESERYLWLTLMPEDRSREILAGCRALKAAIVDGNAPRAQEVSYGHIATAKARVLEQLTRHASLIDQPIDVRSPPRGRLR